MFCQERSWWQQKPKTLCKLFIHLSPLPVGNSPQLVAWCQNTSNYSKGVSNFCTTPNSRNVLNYSKGVSSMFSLCQGSVSGVWTPRTGHPGSDLTWKCESNIHIMSETLSRTSVRNRQIGFGLGLFLGQDSQFPGYQREISNAISLSLGSYFSRTTSF